MRPDRQMAIDAMCNMGWRAERTKPGKTVIFEFRRHDTGGWYDVVRRRQDQLSMGWVADIAMRYGDADDLKTEVAKAKKEWLRQRFHAIFKRAEAARDGAQP